MAPARLDRPQSVVLDSATRLCAILKRISRRKMLVCLLAGLAAMLVRIAALPLIPIPQPVVHDEFAYLLGSETFAAGRLANPTPPMWIHIETLHENFQPTYASKYPPLQSLLMSVGLKLVGNSWFGVCLTFGLMCAALCWMLQGWVPPFWALIGTLLGIAQIGIFSYWMDSYWGGAACMAAGCLMLGALPRLARKPTAGAAALGSLGLMMLANCRPFEGSVTALAAGVALIWWRRRMRRPVSELFSLRILAPFAVICGLSVAWIAYYNYRVTGNPLLLPYAVNARTYMVNPQFFFMPRKATVPQYHHEMLRRYWAEWCLGMWARAHQNPLTILRFLPDLRFYLSWPLALATLAGILIARSRKVRIALAILGAGLLALLVQVGFQPHYFAPAAALLLLPILAAVRYTVARSGRYGPLLLVLFLLLAVKHDAGVFVAAAHDRRAARLVHRDVYASQLVRPQVEQQLAALGGQHVVIVRYPPQHDPNRNFEVVYNHADLDASTVIWARDMGPDANRELLQYYSGRRFWLLDPDAKPWMLSPYTE